MEEVVRGCMLSEGLPSRQARPGSLSPSSVSSASVSLPPGTPVPSRVLRSLSRGELQGGEVPP